jgi:hypothetical protein
MSNENYPAGVTDAHPHFNPRERPVTVDCTSDEALVVPSFTIKADLIRLRELTGHGANMAEVDDLLAAMQHKIDEVEREGGYECQWVGELDLPVSEEAIWDCPRCGVENTTDTILEDEDLDPDRAYDEMRDARYDD